MNSGFLALLLEQIIKDLQTLGLIFMAVCSLLAIIFLFWGLWHDLQHPWDL
jgi:hypothetical protein